jgi:hypothetical protein
MQMHQAYDLMGFGFGGVWRVDLFEYLAVLCSNFGFSTSGRSCPRRGTFFTLMYNHQASKKLEIKLPASRRTEIPG